MVTKKLWTALLVSFILLLPVVRDVAQEQKVPQASIPFEFWVGGNRVPAGIYQIEELNSTSYFVLRSTDGKTIQQVYVLPVDESPAKKEDAKLVFRIADGKHYLYGGWGSFGRRVVSVESARPVPSGKDRADVPITYR